jgi:hypothetical protein
MPPGTRGHGHPVMPRSARYVAAPRAGDARSAADERVLARSGGTNVLMASQHAAERRTGVQAEEPKQDRRGQALMAGPGAVVLGLRYAAMDSMLCQSVRTRRVAAIRAALGQRRNAVIAPSHPPNASSGKPVATSERSWPKKNRRGSTTLGAHRLVPRPQPSRLARIRAVALVPPALQPRDRSLSDERGQHSPARRSRRSVNRLVVRTCRQSSVIASSRCPGM